MSIFIRFEGAAAHEGDNGLEYTPRGPIMINSATIVGYYDHTILTSYGSKIRVMETFEEIAQKFKGVWIRDDVHAE